jgi:hypothetical protein
MVGVDVVADGGVAAGDVQPRWPPGRGGEAGGEVTGIQAAATFSAGSWDRFIRQIKGQQPGGTRP